MQNSNTDSEESFREIFGAYYLPLVNYACTFLNDTDDAEDIVQEVFVAVWERLNTQNMGDGLKPYLYRSVKNRCLNFLRDSSVKQKNRVHFTEDDLVELDISHAIIREEVYVKLLQVFETLPPQCKKIYQLSLAGLKASEIAQELSLSVETVKAQKKRAKRLFVSRLGKMSYALVMLSSHF